ncbi:MAG: transglycosylase SLT domain-containing protein [Fusobacteriota bacterium]
MNIKYITGLLIISSLVSYGNLEEWEKQKAEVNKSFDIQKQESNRDFEENKKEWIEYYGKVEEKWEAQKDRVEKVWNERIEATKTQWIEFSDDNKTYSKVDFDEDKGYIEIKTMVDSNKGEKEAQKNINKQLNKIISEEDPYTKKSILKDIVKEEDTEINKENVESVDEVNGKKVYRSRIYFVSDFIERRAKQYVPLVQKYAKIRNLNPGFVMAIIHTESSFNPKVKSHIPAYGLMQLVPRYGGLEGYHFVNKSEKILKENELYDPETNIKYGTAYLQKLKEVYYRKILDPEKNKYLVITSYNWGPTNIRKKIINRYDVEGMSDGELYSLLRKKTPHETSNYIERVTRREREYSKGR